MASSLPLQAAALFAGVSDIEVSQVSDNQVLIRFQADLPFQYQIKVLDADHIALTLLNARIASQLKEAGGSLHLAPNSIVDKGQYTNIDSAATPREDIILEGAGLGRQDIVIDGATLALQEETGRNQNLRSAHREEELDVSPRLQKRQVATVPSRARTMARGPQIADIRQLPNRAPALILQEPDTPTQADITLTTPYSRPGIAPASAVREPKKSHPMKAIPHYQGGTPPIAFTLGGSHDTHTLAGSESNPLTISHKPREEGQKGGGFNALSLVEESPGSVKQLMQAALSYYRQNELYQAQESISRALTLEPENGALYAALAEIYLKTHEVEKAKGAYQEAIKFLSNPAYQERYAVVLIQGGDRLQAIEVLEKLLQQEPNNASAHYLLGSLYQALGQTALALSHLQRAEQLNPQSADIHYSLGLEYELEGNRELAKTHYAKAIQLNPVSHEAVQALERVRS